MACLLNQVPDGPMRFIYKAVRPMVFYIRMGRIVQILILNNNPMCLLTLKLILKEGTIMF